MLKSFIAIAAFAASISTTDATEVRLGAAKEGGGYDKAMRNLARILKDNDIVPVVTNFDGSEDIATALCAGKIDFAPLQIDAYRNAGERGCQLDPVGVYGSEITHLFFPKGSDKDELHDLGKGDAILIGKIGSGSALTFETMVSIEKGEHGNKSDWSNVTLVHKDHTRADAAVAADGVDAVFLVSTMTHPTLKKLMKSGWEMGDVDDKDINDLEFNGASLYTQVDTSYEGYWTDRDTYEVRTLYAATMDFASDNPEAFNVITRVMDSLKR